MNADYIRKVLKDLEFLSNFRFQFGDKEAKIELDHSKRLDVSIAGRKANVRDVNAAIRFLTDST